jgi:hypothetical protein
MVECCVQTHYILIQHLGYISENCKAVEGVAFISTPNQEILHCYGI